VKSHRQLAIGFAAVILSAVYLPLAAEAGPLETVLHNFTDSPDGALPSSSVLLRRGAIYGVSSSGATAGGYSDSGLVFKLTPPAAGQKQWRETSIHSFGAPTVGMTPVGQLVADSGGALYGVTQAGGAAACSCGTVFKLTPPASPGGDWARQILHSFRGNADGSGPAAGLTFGPDGALYGTTYSGGYGGTVFRLAPPAAGTTAWTKTTIYQFDNFPSPDYNNNKKPSGRLLLRNGYIYGTTSGISADSGTAFRLTPPAKGKTAWTATILFVFKDGDDGGDALGGVIMDAAGALYGTTYKGGIISCPPSHYPDNGCGIVYRLTPPAKGTPWKETVLHRFANFNDGSNPMGELLMDGKGVLYGTTSGGGNEGCVNLGVVHGCGTIFKLTPPAPGKTAWTETILYRFPERGTPGNLKWPNGKQPQDGLAADAKGNLYGTAYAGGGSNMGVVFELAGSGFAVH
jgi:uncharacterized repeat protein (TIGR03803 family)